MSESTSPYTQVSTSFSTSRVPSRSLTWPLLNAQARCALDYAHHLTPARRDRHAIRTDTQNQTSGTRRWTAMSALRLRHSVALLPLNMNIPSTAAPKWNVEIPQFKKPIPFFFHSISSCEIRNSRLSLRNRISLSHKFKIL
jgi:hypothetical protein